MPEFVKKNTNFPIILEEEHFSEKIQQQEQQQFQ